MSYLAMERAPRHPLVWCEVPLCKVKKITLILFNFNKRDEVNARNCHFPLGKNTYCPGRTGQAMDRTQPVMVRQAKNEVDTFTAYP